MVSESPDPDPEAVDEVVAPNDGPTYIVGFSQTPIPRAWRCTYKDKRKTFTDIFEFERETDIAWAKWAADGFMAQISQIRKSELQILLNRAQKRADKNSRGAGGALFEVTGQDGKRITITRKTSATDGGVLLVHEACKDLKNPLGKQLFQVLLKDQNEEQAVAKCATLLKKYADGEVSDLKAEKEKLFPRAAAKASASAKAKSGGNKSRRVEPKATAASAAPQPVAEPKASSRKRPDAKGLMSDSDDLTTDESSADNDIFQTPVVDFAHIRLGADMRKGVGWG